MKTPITISLNVKIFIQPRTKLFQSIREFAPITLQKLLFGDLEKTDRENEKIIHSAQIYIQDTKRFTT